MGFNDINIQVSGPQQPASTYKTKVLKGQVPFATQVTEPNTKYVIKHNFVLNGDVTIPANCILEFDGGSISGEHAITGNNTGIEAGLIKIFNTDVTLAGAWNVAEAYPEWFDCKHNSLITLNSVISSLFVLSDVVSLYKGTYRCDNTITIPASCSLVGSVKSKILYVGTTTDIYKPVVKLNGDNASILDIEIDGNTTFNNSQVTSQGATVGIWGGFYTQDYNFIKIHNCIVHNCSLHGIILVSSNSEISNCEVYNVGLFDNNIQKGGIWNGFIYETTVSKIENNCIENNTVYNCSIHCIFSFNSLNTYINNNKVLSGEYIGIGAYKAEYVSIVDNVVKKTKDNGIDLQQCSNSLVKDNSVISCGNQSIGEAQNVASGIFFGDDLNLNKSFNNVIEGNTIIGNPSYEGTQIESDDFTAGYGIYAHNDINSIIRNNNIYGIADLNDYSFESKGMMLAHVRNVIVDGNTVKYTRSNAMYISIQYNDYSGNYDYFDHFCKIINNTLHVTNSSAMKVLKQNRGCRTNEILNNTIITSSHQGIEYIFNSLNNIDRVTNISGNILNATDRDNALVFISIDCRNELYLNGVFIIDKNYAINYNSDAIISLSQNLHFINAEVSNKGIGNNYLFGASTTMKIKKNPLSQVLTVIGDWNDSTLGSIETDSTGTKIKTAAGWKLISVS